MTNSILTEQFQGLPNIQPPAAPDESVPFDTKLAEQHQDVITPP